MSFDVEIQTDIERFEKKLKWTINNVLNYDTSLESPPFSLIPDSSWWIIQLMDDPGDGCFKIYFKKCDVNNTTVKIRKVDGDWIFKDPTSSKILTITIQKSIQQPATLLYSCGGTFLIFLRRNLMLTSDAVIIECHLTLTAYIDGDTFCKKDDLKEMIPPNDEVQTTLTEKIFKRSAYTDVTFSFGEKTLRAHKAVLTVTSPVFENMFKHDTLENQTNIVSIADVDIDVFKSFLEFLYTRKINENMKSDLESMLALYEVSDKYEVCELQRICANILVSNFLNVESACKILKLADLHGDSSMKDILFKFLKQKFSEVVKTDEWSSLTTENIKLASEVVAFITHQMN